MREVENKLQCCGCEACKNICPQNCIVMKEDDEGFQYPIIKKMKCISCGLCEKVCPMFNELQKECYDIKIYGCKNKDDISRSYSSSGGVFILLCEEVINQGGVVFGAAFDDKFNVRHMFAEVLSDCEKFKGSKYVQSVIGDSFNKVKTFLENGRVVLYSGTQCQVKGLKLFLRKDYENLITVDVICHGVPSPLVFRKYKNMLAQKNSSKIKEYRFRDKCEGWHNFSTVVEFDNETKYVRSLREDTYMKGFLSNLYLRPSCYECKAKNFTSGSDLSLADYWGIEKINSEFDDNKGVSLVLVNTHKGENLVNSIICNVSIIKADLSDVVKYNPCIIKSVEYNSKRKNFFRKLNDNNINDCIEKSFDVTFLDRVKAKVKYEFTKVNL